MRTMFLRALLGVGAAAATLAFIAVGDRAFFAPGSRSAT
jgi:hypothetical protein